ncbi:MAG: hypothetical protein ACAI38_24510 [Myxococcota bacterium]|nr:hypothetical protein [Myxococcota bacterium]
MKLVACAWLSLLVACSSSTPVGENDHDDGPPDLPDACNELAMMLGVERVAIGADMESTTANAAPFDVHYVYIASELPALGACVSCTAGCAVGGAWWGCWQDTSLPPGQYVRDFVANAKARGQVPMFTYYQILQATGYAGNAAEMAFLNNDDGMRRYYADFKRLLQNIGDERAIIHVEPDFWGHLQIESANDAHARPAAVSRVNTDCAGLANDGAGFGRCVIAMTRKYAPNAVVGLHASVWGTLTDVLANTNPSFDLQAEAVKLATFLRECGAAAGDFIASDMSDRDAGWYEVTQGQDTWLDTGDTLPNFTQALTWGGHLATSLGVPIVWWQIPMGNAAMNNTHQHWKDNRVDYLFSHMNEVAAAHVAGLFFGTGNDAQTSPETDGGNLIAKVNAYAASSAGSLSCE